MECFFDHVSRKGAVAICTLKPNSHTPTQVRCTLLVPVTQRLWPRSGLRVLSSARKGSRGSNRPPLAAHRAGVAVLRRAARPGRGEAGSLPEGTMGEEAKLGARASSAGEPPG